VKALDATGRVAIAKVVIRNKQHLACLREADDALVLETMYYADEVRKPEDVPKPQVRDAEVEMARTLIENLAAEWEPERYHDRYRNQLLDLLRAKADGEPLPEPDTEGGGEVIDLMEALRQSVQASAKGGAAKRRSSGKADTAKTGGPRKRAAAPKSAGKKRKAS
jgi:DNA end-binding protein Ku